MNPVEAQTGQRRAFRGLPRTMGRRAVEGLVGLALLAGARAEAVELRGAVTQVTGSEVRLTVEGDQLPQVGDPVRITFRIPGGPEVSVGTWKVTGVEGDAVLATAVEPKGTPVPGHTAIISSANPRPRARPPGEAGRGGDRTDPAAAPPGGPWLGVRVIAGAAVTEVAPGSPAERGALESRDVIVRWDGQPVRSVDELLRRIADTTVGATVEVVVIRRGEERTFRVTIGARPAKP